jgi:hypothetical protein
MSGRVLFADSPPHVIVVHLVGDDLIGEANELRERRMRPARPAR